MRHRQVEERISNDGDVSADQQQPVVLEVRRDPEQRLHCAEKPLAVAECVLPAVELPLSANAFENLFKAGRALSINARSVSSSDASARSIACSRALPSRVTHSSANGVRRRQAARPSSGSVVRSTSPTRWSCLTRVLTEL